MGNKERQGASALSLQASCRCLLLCSWLLGGCHTLFGYQASNASADAAVVSDAAGEGQAWDAGDGGSQGLGRLISGEGSHVLMHEITPFGEGFAVVWSGYSASAPEEALYVSVLSASGEPRWASSKILELDQKLGYLRVLARDKVLGIFYQKENLYLWYVRLDLSEDLPPESQLSETRIGSYSQPWVFSLQEAYGLVYVSDSVVHLRRLDAEGIPGDLQIMPNSTGYQSYPSALATEQGVVLAWRQGSDVFSAALDLDLKLSAGSWRLPKRSGESSALHTEIAPLDDGRSVLAWHTSDKTLFLLALNANASTSWPEPLAIEADNMLESLDYALAGGRDQAVVVWESDRLTAFTQVYSSQLSLADDEVPVPLPVLLTESQHKYIDPRLARGSGGVGMVVKGAVQGTMGSFFQVLP